MATNHLLRDHEPWTPFLGIDNGLDDLNGLLRVSGSNNSVIGNHFSQVIDSQSIRPAGATPVTIRLTAGTGNFVSNNHVVAMDAPPETGDSCFSAQVDALLGARTSSGLSVTTVLVDPESSGNTILDSGNDAQVVADRAANAFRPTPTVGF